MGTTALARRVKEKGLELELGAVGIAPIGPSAHAAFLKDWLQAGRAGEMGWMERTGETRADLRRRFPWALSAVVAAVPYLPYKEDRRRQAGLVAHVARYAVGRDYHRVLGGRLLALARFIESESPGARTRAYSDTGPVLERELAVRAGLGWFGKNTNLIGPRGNSWLLLGLVLTDLDLPPDDPATDRCGTCTACIDACPTGAISSPYLVDSTRCISYLTIELRGAIPAGKRADLGDWVLGCDVCQEVCPWNRKTGPVADEAFLPGPHLETRTLTDLVRLDESSFREEFRPTAMERPRRRGLVRNALIVAANVSDEKALRAAEEKLRDPDPVVRGAAAWALGRGGSVRGRRVLERARESEPDPAARAEIEEALAGIAPGRAPKG
jgi:epoxyqueuosine reductase